MEKNSPLHNDSSARDSHGQTAAPSEEADQLSKPLGRLSLGTPTKPSTLAVHTSAANSGNSPRKSSSMSSPGAGSKPLPSSPRASVGPSPVSPGSPRLSRKSSSPMLSRSDHQHTPPRPSSRRVASATTSLRNTALQQAQMEEEKPPLTAASVACDYFKKELDLHSGTDPPNADTVVIVHDSCYGHRYARPKTSKANLSLIVERPERIQASIAGVASAYVRLGGHHTGGDHAPHPRREPSSTVPFRIQKSGRSVPLTDSMISNVHGSKWMQELSLMCQAAQARLTSGEKELSRPATPTGASTTTSKPRLHEGDLYLCGESLDAFQSAIGGVCDGVDAVFQENQATQVRKAFVCIRPPGHHCSGELPSGFCWLNNVHVGIEYAAQKYGLTHAAIIDFDLHHGDGSQSIAWERNVKAAKAQKSTSKTMQQSKKTSVGYFSLHDINSYPCEEGVFEKVGAASVCVENAHGQSIWNVHLQPWSTEAEFWELYHTKYLQLLEKARAFLRVQTQRVKSSSTSVKPRGAIFLSAGFDASQWEMEMMQRHKVNVPTEFYARFTADVLKLSQEEDTGVDTRVISVLEGGYSDRALTSGVLSHLTGLTRGSGEDGRIEATVDGLTGLERKRDASWDSTWWAPETLAELESLHKPQPPPPAPKKSRNTEMATYASPTQSFTAKVVDPSKVYRSLSGAEQNISKSRPPTPPPPDVDWAVASHELMKILIPGDRQIDSFKHEELNEPRVKRERHSSVGLPSAAAPADRQLRGRKPKTIGGEEVQLPTASENEPSKAGRRRTISSLPSMSEDASEEALATVVPSIEPSDIPQTSASNVPSERSSVGPSSATSRTSSKARQPPPSRAPANAVNIHKTRRTSGANADIQKPSAADAKPPPMSRRSSTQSKREDSVANPSRPQTSHGMDELTSGVKKITLRMPKKETEDAKTSKSTTAQPAAKAPRKPPASRIGRPATTANAGKTKKTAKATVSQADTPSTQLNQSGPSNDPGLPNDGVKGSDEPGVASQVNQSVAVAPMPTSQDPSTLVQPTAEPRVDPTSKDGFPQNQAQDTNKSAVHARSFTSHDAPFKAEAHPSTQAVHEFVPYIPPNNASGSQPQLQRIQQEPLTWLPPNVTSTPPNLKPTNAVSSMENPAETTPSKRNKENLPVFSSKGYIPFSKKSSPPNDATAGLVRDGMKQANTDSDVDLRAGDHTNGEAQTSRPDIVPVGDVGTDVNSANHGEKEGGPGGSVWDVPETPKR